MGLFHKLEDAQVILRTGQGYKQADLYTRHGLLYAKNGSYFVRLIGFHKGTTNPNVQWEEIEAPGVTFKSTQNGLEIKGGS